jgi:uracil-DNA glycosylase
MPDIEASWVEVLREELKAEYYIKLVGTIENFYQSETIYPPQEQIYNAFALCPFQEVKVVILGQDPYHGEGQAHGLAFSVPDDQVIPPSLKNIYKELAADCGVQPPESGNLEAWAKQGVLLINATLTVRASQPGSHQGLGWETFTDAVIKHISEKKSHVVFILWGKYAQAKASLINQDKHLVLKAPHPSPFSAHTGFFGSKPFSQTNTYLSKTNQNPIGW